MKTGPSLEWNDIRHDMRHGIRHGMQRAIRNDMLRAFHIKYKSMREKVVARGGVPSSCATKGDGRCKGEMGEMSPFRGASPPETRRLP